VAVTGSQIVALAEKFRGVPYVWGGESPSGFDCSGLVKYVLTALGVKGVPRTSEDQWNWVDKIPADQVQTGDLVFFSGSDGTPSSPGHVGIVVAPGTAQHGPEMIDAPYTGTDVQVQGFDPSGTGVGHVVGYGRIPGTTTAGASGTGGSAGGILSWPSDITGFFGDADHALGTASAIALAFFQPSTYIRIAVGGLAVILLVTGLLFLIRAASDGAG
jgi:cell wall-associated NlpC family hydrolase